MPTISEKRLVQKLQRRDARAFELLMSQYQTPILNILYRMIGVREEAEDLAQEVFVTVFKKIDTFRGDSSLSTWIFRIALNHCKNRKKYLWRRGNERTLYGDMRPHDELKGQQTAAITSRISRPDELVEGYQAERIIQKAIDELDEDQRLVLVLHDIQNVSYEDISAITGVPLGTVKSRLHRGRMFLKNKLASLLRTK